MERKKRFENVPEVGNIDSLCTGIALDVVPAGVGPAFDLYAALNFFVFFLFSRKDLSAYDR